MRKTKLALALVSLVVAQGVVVVSVESAEEQTYVVPKTSWGEPDLQGMWPLNHLIGVPMQRNVERYGDRFEMTEEEYAAAQESVAARDERFQSGEIPVADAAGRAMRQTSLIFDPPNGRIPPLTPYGEELRQQMKSSYDPNQTVFDSIADFSAWDRCITRGMPVSMMQRNYNNGLRIFQSPGYVVIALEMAHEARIIPTNGLAPLPGTIKQWLGESRGHWEGDTLVVETTNFGHGIHTGLTSGGVPGAGAPMPTSDNMKITERFTRTADDTIEFEMLIEDPDVLTTGSMTIKYPLYLDNDYKMYEYSCHEGNTAVRYYIETSRFERGVGPSAEERAANAQ
ncbi:MAG: hypothetical protein SV422_16725 [Pseudomonadota bacterium]|nr:hypothetical protein [Pseudomonadota bacterium]